MFSKLGLPFSASVFLDVALLGLAVYDLYQGKYISGGVWFVVFLLFLGTDIKQFKNTQGFWQ